ncbi:bifunctional cytochrome P450/NADPH--P450 reductase [Ktedonospora formicarum]|uniref:Bifunctional cytochrome P450/NADPH--P450 reductase n=1 Tax=Ktedonospora formicarum TaxID=2778364 RepID=A0A8J3HXT7_9CHLR|nr:cytochrome P450 [Ktedonospora formicarum]GHO42513.1 NADPH--cytochrome P450 reductase [Ktedonospora formicarum]
MYIEDHTLTPIPQPHKKPLVGNLYDIDPAVPVLGMMELARELGPIFQLEIPGRRTVIVSGFELVDELSDESRFDKRVWRPLLNVRSFSGDGLFTAHTQEANWHKAHNILMPNFSMRAMQGYMPMMQDIAEQLLEKWERLNPNEEIDVPGDMTRLTLDTIGLCGFDYRFNSFYREDAHPFVQSMVNSLGESMARGRRLPIQEKLMVNKHRQFQSDVDYMNNLVDDLIRERKANSNTADKKDLLSYMLSGIDKQSGQGLDDVNIRYQIITFLIAGHETTSGLLSFALYFLLKHPDVLAKAYAEVDRVLGPDTSIKPTFQQINKLRYVSQVLNESLRLWPTAPLFSVYPYEETVIADKYRVDKDSEWAILIPMLHRDKSVWGEDAEEFNPDHFSHEAEATRPANAFKPFGNGQRACIGRQFAMQEATLVLGQILQRFHLIDHTNYELKVKQTLTLKPEGLTMRVCPRTDADRDLQDFVKPIEVATPRVDEAPRVVATNQHNTPLLVLHGSNMGTSEELAHTIMEDGKMRGFAAQVASLDDYAGKLPTEGAVVVVTSSYNGTPPDNAAEFCGWLKREMPADALKGVKYTVFGCGNRDWFSTFQAIPRLVDSNLERHGAQRIYQRGEGDAADDFDGQFQSWYQGLWNELGQALQLDLETSIAATGPRYTVEIVTETHTPNPFVASFGAYPLRVVANRELNTQEASRSTRHVELAIPTGSNYRAGDHLGIIARNTPEMVKRVAARFHFTVETRIRLHQGDERRTHLPIHEPVRVYDLLADYVELQEVATRTQIKVLAEHTECPPEKMRLLTLCGDDETSALRYREGVLAKRKTLIDLLEENPACELPFHAYLEMLTPIRPRYYSISSSPLKDPKHCSITVGVIDEPAWSGHGTYQGVCSNHLRSMQDGNIAYAFVRDTKSTFRLPEDARTPLIMIGPGTGLAPFRGFLQEREAQKNAGQEIGPSLLFFGCRHPQQDFIYEDELKAFERADITELHTAFSRVQAEKVYVQHRLWEQRGRVWELIESGAVIYVCGDASQMAPDVQATFARIYQEQTGKGPQEAAEWLQKLSDSNRYLVDVWGN